MRVKTDIGTIRTLAVGEVRGAKSMDVLMEVTGTNPGGSLVWSFLTQSESQGGHGGDENYIVLVRVWGR